MDLSFEICVDDDGHNTQFSNSKQGSSTKILTSNNKNPQQMESDDIDRPKKKSLLSKFKSFMNTESYTPNNRIIRYEENLKYTEFKQKDWASFELIEPDPIIPGRSSKAKEYDCEKDDVQVFITNATVLGDRKYVMSINGVLKEVNVPNVYIDGVLSNGESVNIKYTGYKPYFYVKIPESVPRNELADHETKERVYQKFVSWVPYKSKNPYSKFESKSLPWSDVSQFKLVYKHPSSGFRNNETAPWVYIELNTIEAYNQFVDVAQRLFPLPTKFDVANGEIRDDYVVCEGKKISHEIKLANRLQFQYFGWVRLPKQTYINYHDEKIHTLHRWRADKIISLPSRRDVAPVLREYMDIEQIRYDEKDAMPDSVLGENDWIGAIAASLSPSNKKWKPYHFLFTWGGDVKLPLKDKKGVPVPRDRMIFKIYKSEADMLNGYIAWRKKYHPDVWVTYGGYNYDYSAIINRINTISGIKEETKCFMRVDGYRGEVVVEDLSIQVGSQKIALWTPMVGEIPWDMLLFFKKDVMFRPNDYKLNTIASMILGEEKEDVHHSLIKPLHMGTPEERGRYILYNWKDVDVTLKLDRFFYSSVNVCRIGRNTPNTVCNGGQQKRMLGGFHHTVSNLRDGVLYRPPYHPILDLPIGGSVSDEKRGNSTANVASMLKKRKSASPPATPATVHGKQDWQSWLYADTEMKDVDEVAKMEEEFANLELDFVPKGPNCEELKAHLEHVKEYGSDLPTHQKKKPSRYGYLKDKMAQSEYKFGGKNFEELTKDLNKQRRFTPPPSTITFGSQDANKRGKSKKAKKDEQNSYAGGFVMEPFRGFWEVVVVADFNSLYPSIMITYCLDASNIVLDKRYLIPSLNYMNVTFYKGREVVFAQGFEGMMNQHLRLLLDGRNIAKAIMANFITRLEFLSSLIFRVFNNPRKEDGSAYKPLEIWKLWDTKIEWWKTNVNWYSHFMEMLFFEWNKITSQKFALTSWEGKKNPVYQNRYFIDKIPVTKEALSTFSVQLENLKSSINDSFIFPSDPKAPSFQLLEQVKKQIASLFWIHDKCSAWSFFDAPDSASSMKKQIDDLQVILADINERYDARCIVVKSPTTVPEFDAALAKFTDVYSDLISNTETFNLMFEKKEQDRRLLEDSFAFIQDILDMRTSWISDNIDSPGFMTDLKVFFENKVDQYNAEQNEFKVAANSIYGVQGAGGTDIWDEETGKLKRKGIYTVVPVSAAVTKIGRSSIEAAYCCVIENWNACVIYGDTDSFFAKFPLNILPNGKEGMAKSFDFMKKEVIPKINKIFSFPGSIMKMAHEKTCLTINMIDPKCYVADYCEKPTDAGKIVQKGVKSCKRDTAQFVKVVCEELNYLIMRHDVFKAQNHIRKRLKMLIDDYCSDADVVYIYLAIEVLLNLLQKCINFLSSMPKMIDPTTSATELKKFQPMTDKLLKETQPVENPLSHITRKDFAEFFEKKAIQEYTDDLIMFTLLNKFNVMVQRGYCQKDDPMMVSARNIIETLKSRDENPIDITKLKRDHQDLKALHDKFSLFKKDKLRYEDFLIFQKLFSASYDPNNVPAHVQLRDRIEQRTPGMAPKNGESVKYIFYENDSLSFIKSKSEQSKIKKIDCIEDFDYAKQKKLKPDLYRYLSKDLTSSLNKYCEHLQNDKFQFTVVEDMINYYIQKKTIGTRTAFDIAKRKKAKTELPLDCN